MEKPKLTRAIIHIIARYSNWSESGVENALRDDGTLATRTDWAKFLHWFLLGVGAAFTLAGIVFFFAFNWEDMPKFVKLGLIQGLIVGCIAAYFMPRLNQLTKNILLSAASVLVGALFAVFGQIYQSGANAYDFFLGWAAFIAIWSLISGFAPLWLLLLIVCNATLILYQMQVAQDWADGFWVLLLFMLNVAVVVACEWQKIQATWFPKVVALYAVGLVTYHFCFAMFSERQRNMWLLYIALACMVTYIAGIWQGLRSKQLFYLAIIPFSLMLVASSYVINLAGKNPIGVFLMVSVFIIGATTLLIRTLIDLNKKWHVKSN